MRVLFLATRFPIPPWRGDQMRAYHQLQQLAGRHDITLAALCEHLPSPAQRAEVEGWGVRVALLPIGRLGRAGAVGQVLAGDPRPLQTLWYWRASAERRLADLMGAERFDLVHAQLVRTAAYLPGRNRPPVVIDFIDALSANMRRRAERSRGPISWVASIEARRLAAYEQSLMTWAAAGVVVAREDAGLIGSDRVTVVPNGVDGVRFAFDGRARVRPRIVFGGNLGYFPNVDAAVWLARDIFPRVRDALPAAELRLVGARPARVVRALGRLPGVTVVGNVPSMGAELAAGGVALLPMRAGTGLQNKVLEALAVGTPVVATPRATAALDVRSGEHLLIGADASALAAAAVHLLVTPAVGAALAQSGRRLVEEQYLWAGASAALEAVWRAAAPRVA